LVGLIPDGPTKRKLNYYVSITYNRILARAVSVIVTYHNEENKAHPGGLCVANHTSPLDVNVLSMDNCYALVGQTQGGLLGLIQRAQSRAAHHIWFERAESNDRAAVVRRLREHVEDPNKLPVLIFPEGTCINNTSIMMFKKGSFEVGGVIYPAAIKYDARLGDAFWNSSKQSYLQYTLMLMTSWATVADVQYLPPMTRREGESGIDFAARVKHVIAEAGGLVELEWDGMLKRYTVKPELVDKQRERYSKRIINSGKHMDRLSEEDAQEGAQKRKIGTEHQE
jgi:glycerol-3-phosphate O-acyltransferase 3/4